MVIATTAPQPEPLGSRIVLYLAGASTIAVLFSIAASQILLGAALLAMLITRTKPRLPGLWVPLAVFMGLTVLALAASGNPAAGLSQIRKFFVYLTLVTLFSTLRRSEQGRNLVLFWSGAAALGAAVSLAQLARKVSEAHSLGQSVYESYLGQRVTGFMTHWQTFGGEQMIVVLTLLAFLMFSPRARGWWLAGGIACALLLTAALVADYTRGIWAGTVPGVAYLVWRRRRLLVLVLPILAALVMWLDIGGIRPRVMSIFKPHGHADSNEFRVVCWRTGWQMIKAHPVLGLGPEIVRLKFMDYVPADVPRPLPLGWYGHLHNVYLHYAAERGIPAALAIVALFVVLIRDSGRALARLPRGPSDARSLIEGGIAVTIAVAISGMFELNLGDSEVLMLFLAVAALTYVGIREAQRV